MVEHVACHDEVQVVLRLHHRQGLKVSTRRKEGMKQNKETKQKGLEMQCKTHKKHPK